MGFRNKQEKLKNAISIKDNINRVVLFDYLGMF